MSDTDDHGAWRIQKIPGDPAQVPEADDGDTEGVVPVEGVTGIEVIRANPDA